VEYSTTVNSNYTQEKEKEHGRGVPPRQEFLGFNGKEKIRS
jgi:hypothetical protein